MKQKVAELAARPSLLDNLFQVSTARSFWRGPVRSTGIKGGVRVLRRIAKVSVFEFGFRVPSVFGLAKNLGVETWAVSTLTGSRSPDLGLVSLREAMEKWANLHGGLAVQADRRDLAAGRAAHRRGVGVPGHS